MGGHTIVVGGDALAMRIVEELNSAGTSVVELSAAAELVDAGIAHAASIICVGDDDADNLEMALLARQSNPAVRVVARLANSVLREAVAAGNGPGAILDVADLAAPSVVEACLARTTHAISVAGVEFIVSGTDAPRDATLRDIYGDLAPVAVIHGETSHSPGEVVACPGRDLRVRAGDWITMIGTAEELAGQGIAVAAPSGQAGSRRSVPVRMLDAFRVLCDDVNPMFFRALGVAFTLLIGSTVLLRFAYHKPGMSIVDALYFTTETIATGT
ncbi:MAG TPA: NAD-binding protein, partial [Mycobacterium sp.]|nr:NAD-binding protein [Mycobacterium sp.]